MERKTVSSSNILSIGYDEDSNTLEIEFKNGAVYQYFEVNMNIYKELMEASSHGQYLAQHIKGHYRYVRV